MEEPFSPLDSDKAKIELLDHNLNYQIADQGINAEHEKMMQENER